MTGRVVRRGTFDAECGCDDLSDDEIWAVHDRPEDEDGHCFHTRWALGNASAPRSMGCGKCGRLWEIKEVTD